MRQKQNRDVVGRFTESSRINRLVMIARFKQLVRLSFGLVFVSVPLLMAGIEHVEHGKWYFDGPALEFPVIETAHAESAEPSVRSIESLADYIWFKESTRGKNNYSKCESVGLVNGIGYAIPGDGSYVCFESHDEEMTVLSGWLTFKRAAGWSDLEMLCKYSGSNYSECK